MMMARIQEQHDEDTASSSLSSESSSPAGAVVLENIPRTLSSTLNNKWHQADAELAAQEPPSVAETDVSSVISNSTELTEPAVLQATLAAPSPPPSLIRLVPERTPLQWQFYGLTLWLEYEEFDYDLTKANHHFASMYGTEVIPTLHSTAIYGMKHLSVEECRKRLHEIPSVLPNGEWPLMERPVAVKQDIAIEGRPGQVCSIAWAELTLKTNDEHEQAMDAVHKLFEVQRASGPWTPHLSLAYDNPQGHVLNLMDMIQYVGEHPSLFRERRVKAISLWDTNGRMGDWKCLDRVDLLNHNKATP